MSYKIGQSTDIHKIKKTLFFHKTSISLGLEKITTNFKIIAHSDGDILIHVIAEAIIGALGLKDLGHHFASNNENKNISGEKILKYCNELLIKHKYKIINLDCLIILDNFILKDYLDIFAKNIAKCFDDLPDKQINVKATTSEKTAKNIIQAKAIILIKKTL